MKFKKLVFTSAYFFQITNPALIDLIRRKVKLNQPYVGVFLKNREEYVSVSLVM